MPGGVGAAGHFYRTMTLSAKREVSEGKRLLFVRRSIPFALLSPCTLVLRTGNRRVHVLSFVRESPFQRPGALMNLHFNSYAALQVRRWKPGCARKYANKAGYLYGTAFKIHWGWLPGVWIRRGCIVRRDGVWLSHGNRHRDAAPTTG